jgi:hypothetical protein
MKIISLLFISIFCIPFGLRAQIQMDVMEMALSKLQKKSWQKTITNGKDTTSIAVSETGVWDNPVIDAKLRIKNISDSIITLHPHESFLFITYRFEGKEYRENVNFDIEMKDDKILYPKTIYLQPKGELILYSGNYLVESTSSLKLRFEKTKDNTKNVLMIMPTLKFHYIDKSGIEAVHTDIYNVNIQDFPRELNCLIPDGYYMIE